MNENPTFDEWIAHLFDQPDDRPVQWYKNIDADRWFDGGALMAEYIAETFEKSGKVLAPFRPNQVENGLWVIMREWDYHREVLDAPISLELKRRVIRSAFPLFEQIYLPIYRAHDYPILLQSCEGFWSHQPVFEAGSPLLDERLDCLEKILALDHTMVQESALTGLSLDQKHATARVQAIVDAYLARHPEPDFELRIAAQGARNGTLPWC